MSKRTIYLAGGCFWGLEELVRQQPGVIETEVGYTGGSNDKPTYENHPGHAEALAITFDDEQTTYKQLLDFFFRIHDPTTLNQQGNDRGESYRSAIFYQSEQEKQAAEGMIEVVNKSGLYDNPVVTSLEPFSEWWPAEDYHQDYLQKNPGGYTCHFVRSEEPLINRRSAMDQTLELNNGIQMPRIGLGTWQIDDGDDVYRAVSQALNVGYRLIDTAMIYGNEQGVGQAIIDSSVPREEIFVTTKLWNSDQGADSVEPAFQASLERLGLNYVDLYLIHWPMPKVDTFVETWEVFEHLLNDGKVRAIGVSNFKPDHLQKLLDETDVVPAVNQIELHPRLSQAETRDFCTQHGIQIESYSPLMQAGEIFENETLQVIAETCDKTVAQVILRWHIQHGLIPIPKSSSAEHIASNFDVFNFTLTDEQMETIDQLDDHTRINADPDEFNR